MRGCRAPNFRSGCCRDVDAIVSGPGETLLVAIRGGVARLRADGRFDRRFGDDGWLSGSPLRDVSVTAIARLKG